MSSTSEALESGSIRYVWVAAIEGYDKLIASNTSGVVTAWSGYDWSSAIGGLHVSVEMNQSANPWKPFATGGSRCTLTVTQDGSDDSFGTAVYRRVPSVPAVALTATLDRNDTTASVKLTTNYASSGEIHVGTECIAYTGKTGTTFTGLTRGKYSPFGTANGSIRFSQTHTLSEDESLISRAPSVSPQPLVWVGRRVGVWMHRVVDGSPVTRAEAVKVFAGRIAEIRDDPGSMGTIVELEHEMDALAGAQIGHEIWSARVKDGVTLIAGDRFYFREVEDEERSWAYFSELLVVESADPDNSFNVSAGRYTTQELLDKLNRWLAGNVEEHGLTNGTTGVSHYQFEIDFNATEPPRIRLSRVAPTDNYVRFQFAMPLMVRFFLGFSQAIQGAWADSNWFVAGEGGYDEADVVNQLETDTPAELYSADPPLRLYLARGALVTGTNVTIEFDTASEDGSFKDNLEWLPARVKEQIPADLLGEEWGVFVLNDQLMFLATKEDGQLANVMAFKRDVASGLSYYELTRSEVIDYTLPWESSASSPTIRQIHMIEGPFRDIVSGLLYSTGTAGYNHTTYDRFPHALAVGISGELLSWDFDSTLANIPGAYDPVLLVVDKPIRFSEVIESDLILRSAFPVWGDEAIEFHAWRTPSRAAALVSLSESNKGVPGGTKDNPRTASIQSTEWQRPAVKVLHGRDFRVLGADNYSSSKTFVDAVALSDFPNSTPLTIKARNVYDDTESSIEDLEISFGHHVRLFSRPGYKVTRSLSPDLFTQLAPGDIVEFADEYTRDPETGTRGISLRPAIVTRVRYSFGGREAGGSTAPIGGEVDLFYLETAVDRTAEYVPSADVDDTYNAASFSAGYLSSGPTLRCYAHRYSGSDEGDDASNFASGDKIRIIERDPPNPDSPVYWDRTIDSVSGNEITLTATLSSPAWDATKTYRIVSQGYAAATSTQQEHVYQADDADGHLLDSSQPFEYGSPDNSTTAIAAGHSAIEIVSESLAAEGMGRDVGTDYALAKMIDNYLDYKSAYCAPMLWPNGYASNSFNDSNWRLVDCRPVFLGVETYSTSQLREIAVAPWIYSVAGLTSCRVTLARTRPTDATLVNVNRGTVYSEATFTTSAQTWSVPAVQYLDARVKSPFFPIAYILIELQYNCRTRGLARFQEGARTTEIAWQP